MRNCLKKGFSAIQSRGKIAPDSREYAFRIDTHLIRHIFGPEIGHFSYRNKNYARLFLFVIFDIVESGRKKTGKRGPGGPERRV